MMLSVTLIDNVLSGASPCKIINEIIDSSAKKKMEILKPNDKVTVYHGTSKVYMPLMINGFDAAKQGMARHYGGPRHVGLFVTLDPDVADRFSSYGDVILELEVRAKSLHGTDYSGNVWGKKEDDLWTDKYPNSFRPGLTYCITAQGSEPQAILLGMVGPNQIKRIRWREENAPRDSGKWYTRKELLKKAIVIKGEPGSGSGQTDLADFELNLSSTKTAVPELFKAIAGYLSKGRGRLYTSERVEQLIRAHWKNGGEDAVYEMLRYDFKFGERAAKVLAQKTAAYFSKNEMSILDRVRAGEDPYKLVQELTKTSMIVTLPMPMSIVKKTRKKDDQEVESLLEKAQAWLTERQRAPTMIMYHGTASKFLREILKKGLVPNPRMRVWKDDPSASRSVSQETRVALDSVYFTKNFMTAVSAGGDASRKFGGTYLFIAAQIQPRAALPDEDTLKIRLEKAISQTLGFGDDHSTEWFEIVTKDTWRKSAQEIASNLQTLLSRSELPFGLGMKATKIPIDVEGAEEVFRGFIGQQVAKRYAQEGDQFLLNHLWRTTLDDAGFDATDEQKQKVLADLKKKLPTLRDSERQYLQGLDMLTRRYKGLAMPGEDSFAWFSHSLRIPEPVTYQGRNKILTVFQTHTKDGVSYIITHYGKVPSCTLADMQRSSWLSGKKIEFIKPAEAKTLRLNLGD